MRTHVALLRGINVGGHAKVPMAELRDVVTSLGHRDVATYIQSGNVVLTATDVGTDELADALEDAIDARLGLRPAVVALTRAELADVVARNPFPGETDPTHLHVAFHRGPLGPADVDAVAAAEQRARAKGSEDEVRPDGAVLYLRTPHGIGRSELAAQLARRGRAAPPQTTARNWATVTRLLAMLDEG